MTPELEKWSDNHEVFSTLMEMKELLESLGYTVCEPKHGEWTPRWVPVNDVTIEKAFCKKHDIDRDALEEERRKLLGAYK